MTFGEKKELKENSGGGGNSIRDLIARKHTEAEREA